MALCLWGMFGLGQFLPLISWPARVLGSHTSPYARRRNETDGQRQYKIPERQAPPARRLIKRRARRADAPGVRHTPQHDAVGPARQARPVHLARVPPDAVQERRPRARDAAREHDGPDVERPAEVEAAHGEVARGAVDGARRAVVARCPRDDVPACVEIKILRRVRAESSRRPARHRRDTCSMAWVMSVPHRSTEPMSTRRTG